MNSKNGLKLVDSSLGIFVYFILFLMGNELAQQDDIYLHISEIFFYTLLLFACSFGFNFIILMILDVFLPWRVKNNDDTPSSQWKLILDSLKIFLLLVVGFVSAYIPLPIWQYNKVITKVVLVLLLFVVGMQLRNSHITLRQILFNKIGIITTLLVIVSCLVGSLLFAYITNEPINVAMAMSSGYGWYTLSGLLMTDAHGPIIGSITFLNDILRELCAIILIPTLIKRFRLTALGLCGATSMDFTLPMLQKGGGMTIVPSAIVQGFLLTLFMPIIITFLNNYF
ncbi:lysine exporter LysO family protein [Orbaceae bacterium ac157xtp]